MADEEAAPMMEGMENNDAMSNMSKAKSNKSKKS